MREHFKAVLGEPFDPVKFIASCEKVVSERLKPFLLMRVIVWAMVCNFILLVHEFLSSLFLT